MCSSPDDSTPLSIQIHCWIRISPVDCEALPEPWQDSTWQRASRQGPAAMMHRSTWNWLKPSFRVQVCRPCLEMGPISWFWNIFPSFAYKLGECGIMVTRDHQKILAIGIRRRSQHFASLCDLIAEVVSSILSHREHSLRPLALSPFFESSSWNINK